MRWLITSLGLLLLSADLRAADAPRVERYLHSGQLAKGEQALELALAANPRDDETRFGLGVLQFVRAVERFGQALYHYGVKPENTNTPFLRLPVPKNPDPATIHYAAFRRVLDDLVRDLTLAEATLAGVTDDRVTLRLRLAEIHLDLEGSGQAKDRFLDILKKILGQNFDFLRNNPKFEVKFDRGDVAWLRAYCHLLMGMLDFYLAFDLEREFDLWSGDLFAKARNPFQGNDRDRWREVEQAERVFAVKEPLRLGRFRKHLVEVARLNRETWRYIRAETGDDHEWLPNPKQKGVLGLPVRDEFIDAWLGMMGELEALLEGKRTFLKNWGLDRGGKGLNLKLLFDDPPTRFAMQKFPESLPDRYFTDEKEIDLNVLIRVFQIFSDPSRVGYAAWFN
jgi:hypothetical protein